MKVVLVAVTVFAAALGQETTTVEPQADHLNDFGEALQNCSHKLLEKTTENPNFNETERRTLLDELYLCWAEELKILKKDGTFDETLLNEKLSETTGFVSLGQRIKEDCAQSKGTPGDTAHNFFNCFILAVMREDIILKKILEGMFKVD